MISRSQYRNLVITSTRPFFDTFSFRRACNIAIISRTRLFHPILKRKGSLHGESFIRWKVATSRDLLILLRMYMYLYATWLPRKHTKQSAVEKCSVILVASSRLFKNSYRHIKVYTLMVIHCLYEEPGCKACCNYFSGETYIERYTSKKTFSNTVLLLTIQSCC